ncbi:MAG: tetratricopeptide repeat protein [Candidatus Riflebacteria bacterium]
MKRNNRRVIFAIFAIICLSASVTLCAETYEQRFSRAEELMKRGVALGRDKKYPESVIELKKAVELIPDNGPLWYNLGMSQYKSGDKSAARVSWQKTVSLRPDYTDAWYMLGMLEAGESRSTEAIVAYEKCLQAKPGDGEAREALIKECLKLARKNFEQLQKTDSARAKKLSGQFSDGLSPSTGENKHPLADTVIPGTGKTFDELLEIFKRTPFQGR